MLKQVTSYKTTDGELFPTLEKATGHEMRAKVNDYLDHLAIAGELSDDASRAMVNDPDTYIRLLAGVSKREWVCT